MSTDTQSFAKAAYTETISRVTYLVLPTGLHANASPATGLVLRTPAGAPFLLTARHVFEEDPSCNDLVLAGNGRPIERAGVKCLLGPKRLQATSESNQFVDVAAVVLTPAAHKTLGFGKGCSVATETSVDEERDVLVLAGYPMFVTDYRLNDSELEGRISRFLYTTGIEGVDGNGRFRVYWRDAVAGPDAPALPQFSFPTNDVFTLGHPRGISGGGLWRIRGALEVSELWSPSTHCELIGLASAFREPHELCEPTTLWSEWLEQVHESVDAHSGL